MEREHRSSADSVPRKRKTPNFVNGVLVMCIADMGLVEHPFCEPSHTIDNGDPS
jgi:hypothetical protein